MTALRLAVCYTALTVLLAYPLSLSPGHHVMSRGPDTDLYVWTLAWDVHALMRHPLLLFDANIYYPERRTLAYSENLLGSAVIAAPVLWLTGNPVLAMNLLVLLAAPLCGLGAFLLARKLDVSTAGAAIAGLIFAFSPPRFLRLDQLHLATVQWIPFSLAWLHAYIDRGRRRDLHLGMAFFTLQALTSAHGAVFLLVAIGAFVAWRAALGEPLDVRRRLRDCGWVGLLLLAPAVLVSVPYLLVQREMGLRRELDVWAVPASSFLASPTHLHAWLLSLVGAARINETAGAYLFPGILPVGLAALGWFIRGTREDDRRQKDQGRLRQWADRTRRAPRNFYGLLVLLCVWISLGPPLGIWPSIYRLPVLNFIRAPSRFMLLATLAVGVLAGFGFDWVARRLPATRARALAVAAGVVVLAEFAAFPLNIETYALETPAIDRWLASRPQPFVVVELPLPGPTEMGRFERWQAGYMLHSILHWQKTVNGYSGFMPPRHFQLYSRLKDFPTKEGIDALRQLGVTFLVVHTGMYGPAAWTKVERQLEELPSLLHLEHEEGEGRVYSIVQ